MHHRMAWLAGVASISVAWANEPVDLNAVNQIRQEAFNKSKVMETLTELTEKIGPRLTNSPQMNAANDWAKAKLAGWGLANARNEAFGPFGRGWEFDAASVELLAPRKLPLHALPRAWTPGTNGAVEGEAMLVSLKTAADFEKYKGKLKDKVVLISEAREYKLGEKPDHHRYTDVELADMENFPIPKDRTGSAAPDMENMARMRDFGQQLNKFLVEEGVLASINISGWDNGLIRLGGGGSRKAGESVGVPALTMAAEHYNQLVRALNRKETVKLRVNVSARFTSEKDEMGYNTVAEIPGTGPDKKEIVMLGAHMDSWHAGTGAADNAAGVAVMMEAVRILKTMNIKPNRTIRIALWSGEEQGLIGSNKYVGQWFAEYPEHPDEKQRNLPRSMQKDPPAMAFKPDYNNFSAYFNFDNGGGKIRGIYTQENAAAAPIFEEWLKPFNDVGATTVTNRNTGGTDHQSFDRVGLPGFQFIQDPMDYSTNVHHSDMDVLDHVVPEDLKQASAVIAAFVYHAAQRDDRFPRKPFKAD